MSILGAAAGYTLGATVATNIVVGDTFRDGNTTGFTGPFGSVMFSVMAPFGGLLASTFTGDMPARGMIITLAPFAGGAVGAYMGYTHKIPILRDFV